MQQNDQILRKGTFNGVASSSSKKYACKKGELILTSNSFSISCEGIWSRKIPIEELDLETRDGKLEIYFGYYKRHFLKLIVDDPKDWVECFQKVRLHWLANSMERYDLMEIERPKELEKLLEMKPKALRKLYDDISKESTPFETKSIRFILNMYVMSARTRNRRLKAFMVAHCYVAFYERTKRVLYKIYKAKYGKGPKHDEELMEFLNDYPSWKFLLDTSE